MREEAKESSPWVEVKVSKDGGETWERTKINFSLELEDSGLMPGTMFQWQGEKYVVESAEGEMRVKKIPRGKRR